MTIVEIAKKLGVSPSTVSRALNNSHEISAATRNRINEFVKEINFHRNYQATGLRRGASKTIAVVIPDIANYFFSLALDAIEDIANSHNYHVLIYQTHENHSKEVKIINELQNGRVDGVIISAAGCSDMDFTHIENLNNHIPVVFFDRVNKKPGIPTITCNDFQSGFAATRHLVEKKCKRILFVGLSEQISVTNARLAGYTAALKDKGIELKKEHILLCKNEAEAYKEIKNALINIKPDAIFSTVERYTLCIYSLCNELRIKMPEHLKLISFFNSPTAPLLSPPLSSIAHPAAEMGEAAIDFLFQKIHNKKRIKTDDLVLECLFHIRKSSF
jgi:LacI family transcriptional regulator